ncbi:MAG: hypothetical protein DMF91_22455 [Acidobacteria bacterium]|nr:MAG: hypothetical protein DMF91_22455 [Acidobacteriota bacterium]
MTRRRSSVSKPRAHARDASRTARDSEPNITPRLAALENAVREIRQTLDTLVKRTAALQAHLDHVASRLT